MIRKAFRMAVHPGLAAEYERPHNPIWPELEAVLKAHGVHNYSIFHDPADDSLFGYVEIEDEAQWTSIAETDVCKRWWKFMREVMPAHADDRPVSVELREAFHMP